MNYLRFYLSILFPFVRLPFCFLDFVISASTEVGVKNLGYEKLRVTVMLTVRNDGYKCLPYVVLPRKRPDPSLVERFKGKLILSFSGKSWMDDSLTSEYLRAVLGQSLFSKRLLIWDSFRCHLSDSTKKELKQLDVHTALIPGGTTKWLQPGDVCLNGPFKQHIQRMYDDWFMHGEKELTRGGNPRPPPIKVYLGWIAEAWDAISKENVIKSFKVCGIGIASDGSEDEEIHCFKPNGQVPSGRDLLRLAREDKEISEILAEIDLNEDNENGIESDNSIEI